MINAQLVGDSLVFSRKEIEIAKVAAVVSDVFGHFVVGLREIDDAAFSVPAIAEIVYETVLVAFTNQVIKDDDFLVFYQKLFKRKDFITKRFDGLITNAGVNICSKVLQKSLILVLVEVFREEINFVKHQQLVKYVQQDVCFQELLGPQISIRKTSQGMQGLGCPCL